uniref:sodium-dependent transporter n=1 Tax=uncultured Ruthenibacterium sp. TaxID=1905347 RepID=UPI00349EB809
YCAGGLTGSLFQSTSEAYFADMTGPFGSLVWHAAVILITAFILSGGVLKGIEKANRIIMPAFFLLFLGVAFYVAFLPGASAGYAYLLIPDWTQLLNPDTWVMAMGQAFFSLSITGSGMIIYGSYLGKRENIPKAAAQTAVLDTCAALLSGFVILPAVFAFGLDPASGPPLIFITLPKVFAQMPGGRLISIIFFLSVIFAGITSLVNMFEVCAEAAMRHLHLPRNGAIALVSLIVYGVGTLIEYEPRLGSWMDFITIYIVPFGAVQLLFIGYLERTLSVPNSILAVQNLLANFFESPPSMYMLDWPCSYLFAAFCIKESDKKIHRGPIGLRWIFLFLFRFRLRK